MVQHVELGANTVVIFSNGTYYGKVKAADAPKVEKEAVLAAKEEK